MLNLGFWWWSVTSEVEKEKCRLSRMKKNNFGEILPFS